jgi:hypothetical protein
MPVSYARRKLANVLPPEAVVLVLVVVVPAPAGAALLLLPHADAMSAKPTDKDAAVTSHFHVCLRFKAVTSRLIQFAAKGPQMRGLSARGAFLLTSDSQG